MSLYVGILLACAAGLAGTLLCPDDRSGRSRLPLLAALLIGGLSWHAPARAGEILRGPAQVIDGGTLRVGGRPVSLFGIAAPEADATCADAQDRPYPCGRDAARALADRIGGASVACETRGEAGAALCRVGEADLGAWMVAQGLALPDRDLAPDYAPAADRAWGRRLGLWSGVFQDPAERRGRRAAAGLLAAG
ncbi:Endonuclease YncB, thermonuclease family [Methylobacterium sp. 275MFSha3.1]|uniref:thermonuclease family protein n=2 Tax=Methylobacterium TaxID=407 RepID=UPI0008A75CBC|nr:thermonuclease family protein [Methylobacterium sp. 275MFSha3.1]SEH99769.1 Endonuclease YncB, thermonuclease family [Methylobacterium sp. 275MFSha3.1]